MKGSLSFCLILTTNASGLVLHVVVVPRREVGQLIYTAVISLHQWLLVWVLLTVPRFDMTAQHHPQFHYHHREASQMQTAVVPQERLEREYNLDLIVTAPTVVYKAMVNGEEVLVNSPGDLPPASKRDSILEPYVRLEMLCPKEVRK